MDVTGKEDRFLRVAAEALDFMNKAVVPGAFLVDMIPART